MDDLRNYIRNNKEIIDDLEPAEGHLERFEKRLNQSEFNKTLVRRKLIPIVGIAASIAIILWMGIQLFSSGSISGNDKIEAEAASNEFTSTNEFYQRQMLIQINNIKCKLAYVDDQTQNQLEHDLQNIVEENNHFIQKIQNDEDKELAMLYLVKHYRANINALESIDKRLGNYIHC